MSDNYPCEKHEEQIKTLFKQAEDLYSLRDLVYSLDKNMALQTQLLKSVVEHNAKQDKRMDIQQEINAKINDNLTELVEGQKVLNKRVGKLEEKVAKNETKHNIDLRDIEKRKYTDILFKYIFPIGGGIIILLKILEIWVEH